MMLEFPAPTDPWSLNEERRRHWGWKAKQVRAWRDAAIWAWSGLPVTVRCAWVPHRCRVTVTLPFTVNRRRDPHNYVPPVKAIVDGLVRRGVWPDDTPEWVTVTEPVLEVGSGMVRVDLEAA